MIVVSVRPQVAALVVACAIFACRPVETDGLERIRVSEDGRDLVLEPSGRRFVAWGFNYDHDRSGRLLHRIASDWPVVEADFREMRVLGANVVRIFLEMSFIMPEADAADPAALELVDRLIALATREGLYLKITGLGCLDKDRTPAWYNGLSEQERWNAQVRFWKAVAGIGAGRTAVLCYDLMNEPVLPAVGERATEWSLGEMGGKFWAQRLTLDLAGRTPEDVARSWIDTMAAAIRSVDGRALITVGDIAFTHLRTDARPIISSKFVAQNLDIISLHLYPRSGEAERAAASLAAYDIGKPILIGETAALYCDFDDLSTFIDMSRERADGWLGFYWGETEAELDQKPGDIGAALMKGWLELFRAKRASIVGDGTGDDVQH